jgi:hypothetical protein
MRGFVYAWVGLNVAWVLYRWAVVTVSDRRKRELERDLMRLAARLREIDHTEALVEDVWRMAAKRNRDAYRRLYRDAGLLPPDEVAVTPRVTESKEGIFIRASCEAEAAEILYTRYCRIVRAA